MKNLQKENNGVMNDTALKILKGEDRQYRWAKQCKNKSKVCKDSQATQEMHEYGGKVCRITLKNKNIRKGKAKYHERQTEYSDV